MDDTLTCYGPVVSYTCPPPVGSAVDPFSFEALVARLKRFDFIVVYSSLLILAILLLVVVFFGQSTPFYQSLRQPNINPWIIRGLWVLGTVLSYVTFFFLGQDVRVHPVPRDFIVSVLFVISGLLFLAWAVALYYAEDVTLSMWIAIVIFIYNYWLFIYVWNLNRIAALFLIPNLILYGYLVYISAHTASLNNIPI